MNDLVIGLSRNLFKQMLELSVCNSFFVFNNMLYKQKDGLGMGLPLSPTFANIFLSFNEKNWLRDCPPDFAPVYYRRYMVTSVVHREKVIKLFYYLDILLMLTGFFRF